MSAEPRRRAGPQGLPDPRRGRSARRSPLVYLDSAATSQKPLRVLDAMRDFYERHNANVHRGVHTLGRGGDRALRGRPRQGGRVHRRADRRRDRLHQELHRGAQPGRLRARQRRCADGVGPGDEIVVTEMEHHSNLVPWQLLCERTGATLRWIGLTDDGRLDLTDLDEVHQRAHQGRRVRPPVQRARHGQPGRRHRRAGPRGRRARRARRRRSPCRTCRSTSPTLGVDFLAFTGHKMLRPDRRRRAVGPRRAARGAAAVPRRRRDDRDGHAWRARRSPPCRTSSRPGTPMIAAGGRARRRRRLPHRRSAWTTIAAHEHELTALRAATAARRSPGLRIIGPDTTSDRGGAVSFVLDGHPPARRRPAARRAGHRGPRRSPLRAAGLPALRRPGDHAGVVRPLHDDRRDRRAGRRVSPRVQAVLRR